MAPDTVFVRAALKLLQTSTFRLATVYLTVFAISVGAILAYIYWNTAILLERQTEDTVEAEVQGLAEQYRIRGPRGLLEIIKARSAEADGAVYILTNAVGRRLAGNLQSLPVEAVGERGTIDFKFPYETGRGLVDHTARAFFIRLEGGFQLVVGRDVEERRQFNRIIRTSLFWALGLTLVLGVGGGLLMSRNFLRRVDEINGASRAIMAGDLGERMPVSGTGDEIDRLSESLNDMLDQINRLMTGMKEVSSNVAHDLRTPLTRLRARAEDALRSSSAEDHKAALEANIAEADGLLTTFNALLSIARAEAGQMREGFQDTDLVALLDDLVELYGPIAEDAGGTLVLEAPETALVRADRQLVAQAMTNLLDNAIKYGRDAKTGVPAIQLQIARSKGDGWTVCVSDTGPGVDATDRERVKGRFVRLDKSRSEPGSGLGLALVDSVMKLHGGDFEIEGADPGLTARLHFPIRA
ncbi:ATP-binding protein [Anderseniella sp. Alg231-50]|uniref:ATP-binding protein n=1 Tax=Anderseniella sp. Alg231-50 TaxID=1922226 RepID=UPI000D5622A7